VALKQYSIICYNEDMTDRYQNVKSLFPDSKYKDGRYPYFFEHHDEHLVEDKFTEKYGTGIDNIRVISNFFSKDECVEAIDLMKQFEVNESRDHCYPLTMAPDFNNHKDAMKYHQYTEELGPRMIAAAEAAWNEKLTKHASCMLMVHPTGSYLDPHTDILDIHYENNDPSRDEGMSYEDQLKTFPNLWSGHLSILIYLNDDYGRGELYFPGHDYWIKPKSGDIVTFPGSLYYTHGVTAIEGDILRYTASQWALFDFMKK
jgi:hypothetical protein